MSCTTSVKGIGSGVFKQSIKQVSRSLELGLFNSQSLTIKCLDKAKTDGLNTFICLDEAGSLKSAKASDDRKGQRLGELDGIPIGIKDAFCTVDLPTTAGSKMLKGFEPFYDATAVKRLRESGAVILGKNNMDEFCMGSSNTHSHFGDALNPLGNGYSPGGSSGGTAAAVASGSIFAGIGTDTGGSVRQPAAMCGVVGFKPTYGVISRHGVVAMSSSLDTVGIIARSVDDVKLLFDVLRGPDGLDSTCDEERPVTSSSFEKVGISNDFYPEEMSEEVAHCWSECAEFLGWDKETTVDLPNAKSSLPAYYVISTAEASSNLSRYDGVRFGLKAEHDSLESLYENSRSEGFGKETIRRILMGTFVLSRSNYDTFFEKAKKVRQLVANDFTRAFEKVDYLLVPTIQSTDPIKSNSLANSSSPVEEWKSDLLTVPSSLAGLPSISVPIKPGASGIPISMQIIGPRFSDDNVLKLANKLMQKFN